MNSTYLQQRTLSKTAIALGVWLWTASSFAHSLHSPLEMTVISDAAYGDTVVAGEFAEAIEKIEALSERKAGGFFANNNLCVAYTKSGNLDRAQEVCDAAVIKSRAPRISNRDNPLARVNAAMALSNRGVLRVLSGERELALADLQRAVKLRAGLSAPRRNLKFINSRESETVSM